MNEVTTIYQALLAAQQAFGKVLKNATNPAFKSKYADLSSVIETITGPLHANGLVVTQRLDYDQHEGMLVPVLLTELIHAETGERLTSRALVVCKDPSDPQKVGGAVTYFRRYSLLALLGLSPEDDDGNNASQPRRDAVVGPVRQRVGEELRQEEVNSLLNAAARMVADGKGREEIYAALIQHRDRMTELQFKAVAGAWRSLKQEIAERDAAIDGRTPAASEHDLSPAGAGGNPPKPAAYAG